MSSPQNKKRSAAQPRSKTKRVTEKPFESDGAYFLKLVLVFLLGTFWLKFSTPLDVGGLYVASFPLGFFVGLILIARYEHFQSDRKIWYAILLASTVVSCFLPSGIMI